MNTGFSWVRIDKGNIHCNFRYLNKDQVDTAINYLLSYYEYRNVTASVVDLGAAGVLEESGDHYRPSGYDPNKDYYYLVELHRHGTIIPQGCVEILKSALNSMSKHQIIPESVFINRLQTNQLTVDDIVTLTANSTKTSPTDVTWASSDTSVITINPSQSELECEITAVTPGSSDISVTVSVVEDEPLEYNDLLPIPTSYWVGTIYKYVGSTVTKKFDGLHYLDSSASTGVSVTFTHDEYYECVFDSTAPKNYIWQVSSYTPGTPVEVSYRDVYQLIVKTYVEILTKNIQRICLYNFQQMQAYSPSVGLTINWYVSNSNLEFDQGISTGAQVTLEAKRTGTTFLTARITDSVGVYEDSMPITVYAIAVTPKTIKLVTGYDDYAVVKKSDIFHINPDPGITVNWVTSSPQIASIIPVEDITDPIPQDKFNPTTDFSGVKISPQGVGQAFVTAMAEDPTDGTSYSDSIRVTVGNAAIIQPETTVISLLDDSPTLELDCLLAGGFVVEGPDDPATHDPTDGWTSANPAVVEITTISGADNSHVVLTGLAKGTSTITVRARFGSAVDTDTILITVDDAEVVTGGEMATFIHGMYNNHGVIDWNQPTGEEGTKEVDGTGIDLATQEEVEDFVDDLFEPENEEPDDSSDDEPEEEAGEMEDEEETDD